ncbi:MAG TPA: DUF4097 family beta strand repeat-containing protein [Cyclobacteriaceae bacterium]
MKKKSIIISALILLTALWVQAQEFKVSKNSGRLQLYLGRVTVEGHSGNEIIFSSNSSGKEKDERANGLRTINSLGLEDNTGLGINVTDKGNVIEVHQIKKTNAPDIKILVPKGVIVSFTYESQHGGTARFKNMENEIEVDTQYNGVELDNVTGPLTVKTIYGGIDANFGTTIKEPISIVSVYGHVDVTIPQSTKADLRLSTSYGEILVAPEFNIEVEKTGSMVRYSDKVSGKINGGGIHMDLSANYGKVYLRKK